MLEGQANSIRRSPNPSRQSRWGLNGANFFLAEVSGVIIPFLSNYLHENGWRYDAIGVPVALAGLGVFLMQTPAGFITDRLIARKRMFAASSLALGACYGLIPLFPRHWWWVDPLVFLSGTVQAFFTPLLGALALGLAGSLGLDRLYGANQGWNHAGNIAAALMAMLSVRWFALSSIFYAVAIVSVLAAISIAFVRSDEIDESQASGRDSAHDGVVTPSPLRELFRDPRVRTLVLSTALFHLANAPVMPMVALYIKRLGGTNSQVAAVVLIAQTVMIPMAWLTGWCCRHWGKKKIFAVGFLALPIRIFLYSLTRSPNILLVLQALDGIGAGIYGVAVVSMCSDLTRGKGRFNALMGIVATALSLGGVVGPLIAGLIEQCLGFVPAFYIFTLIAAAAAALFILRMPETGNPLPVFETRLCGASQMRSGSGAP